MFLRFNRTNGLPNARHSNDYIIYVQDKETINPEQFTEFRAIPEHGRIVALDPGTKHIGVAVTDETQTIATPVRTIERRSWKKTLAVVKDILGEFDAVALVIGLPINSDGTESEMSSEARRIARNFSLSLEIPVILQDERGTSYEARRRLWERGVELKNTKRLVDSEAAAIILSDFLARPDDPTHIEIMKA
jgi:putative Holliday junction resolvase